MTTRQALSVIIPVFNGAAFLGDAIESVLVQDHDCLQVIVVDDGSTDDTATVAATFGERVLYQRQENAGAASARNRGLSMATGRFIAFLDADDLFMPEKFAQQLTRLDAHPECEIVIGLQQYESLERSDGEVVRIERPGNNPDGLSLQLGCALFRREVFDKVGHFNAALRYCDDWDWFLRAREMGVGILIHRDLVLRQRLHANNLTRQLDEAAKYQRLVFKLSLDRRRAQGGRAISLPPLASFLESAPT